MLLTPTAFRTAAQTHPREAETSFHPAPDSIVPCTKPGCPHHVDPGTGPIPAFIWPSPGCLTAWQMGWTAEHCPEVTDEVR